MAASLLCFLLFVQYLSVDTVVVAALFLLEFASGCSWIPAWHGVGMQPGSRSTPLQAPTLPSHFCSGAAASAMPLAVWVTALLCAVGLRWSVVSYALAGKGEMAARSLGAAPCDAGAQPRELRLGLFLGLAY